MIRIDIGRVTQFPAMTDRPLMSAADPAQPGRIVIEPYADRPEPMQFTLERLVRSVRRRTIAEERADIEAERRATFLRQASRQATECARYHCNLTDAALRKAET